MWCSWGAGRRRCMRPRTDLEFSMDPPEVAHGKAMFRAPSPISSSTYRSTMLYFVEGGTGQRRYYIHTSMHMHLISFHGDHILQPRQ